MSFLQVADSFYVGVRDVATAASWYTDKLGLHQTQVDLEECEGCVALTFTDDYPVAIVIGPVSNVPDPSTRMFYTHAIEKAHKWLASRGVNVGPIAKDRQGTRYFSLLDLESNAIEVSEEP